MFALNSSKALKAELSTIRTLNEQPVDPGLQCLQLAFEMVYISYLYWKEGRNKTAVFKYQSYKYTI